MRTETLTETEQRALLALARCAILKWLGQEAEEPEIPGRFLKEKRGAFVTLRQKDELRGCIGYVEPVESIADAVRQLAVKSASEDPRFPPVHVSEVGTLSIEISILTPVEPCDDVGRIEVGRHGLVVEKGWRRGLLLPEVAVSAGWDAETFLQQCCVKAGLPRDAWKAPDTRIFTFESEHFGEGPPVDERGGETP